MSENPESQHGDEADDALRHWEERLSQNGDPFGALVEVLGGSSSDRNRLFRLTGTVLLGCTLEHMLGSGGGGVTYAGKAGDGSRVAVKLVMAQTLSSVERFEQECRLLQSLEHPSIVRYRAHAVQEDGTGVLVMDLVDGTDFESLLAQVQDPRRVETAAARTPAIARLVQKLDLASLRERGQSVIATESCRRRILRFLAIVAEGLHHAHERGVVHRDVKPPNILVDAAFTPVLIDFGLARDLKKLVSMTQSGIAIGTLAYMAPELLAGENTPVDRRADVYSLGLVLYRATTGRDFRQVPEDVWRSRKRPFLLDAEATRELPMAVQAILYSCLDPRPERRYPDAQRLASDLRAAAGEGDLRARMPSWFARQCRDLRNLVAIVVGLLSAVATILWLQWPRGREVEFVATCEPTEARVRVDAGVAEAAKEARLSAPVWLPLGAHTAQLESDGNSVASVRKDFVVEPGHGPMRVAFPTHRPLVVRSGESVPRTPIVLTTGYRHSQRAPGIPRDQVSVDGRAPFDMPYAQNVVLVEQDEHVLRAVDGSGRVEEQIVRVEAGGIDVQLLPACMADVDGTFRRTWSTVLSPMPQGLTLSGEAQPWIGAMLYPALSQGLAVAPCAVAPVVGDRTASAVLRVDFPTAMRSAVLHVSYFVARDGLLELEVQAEGLSPEPWMHEGDRYPMSLRKAVVAPAGMRWLELRARLRSADVRNPSARLFCGRHFALHAGVDAPAFAVVADPGDAARIPVRSKGEPWRDVATPAAELVREEWAGRSSSAPVVLRHVNGAVDVLVSEFCGVATPPEGHARGRVRRMAWPYRTGSDKTVLEAECMHKRLGVDDGMRFGDMLVAANDRDGDGWSDFLVGDSSSDRLECGRHSSIARFCSSSRDPDWNWPSAARSSMPSVPTRQILLNAGDWDGDAEDDFAFTWRIIAYPPGPGGPYLGVFSGLERSARSTGPWSRPVEIGAIERIYSSRLLTSIGGLDALPVAKGPRPLLYWESLGQPGAECDVRIRIGGKDGLAVGPIALPLSSHSLLLPSRRDPAVPDLVVVRLAPWQGIETGIERYEISGTHLELVDRVPIPLPYESEPHAPDSRSGRAKAAPVQEAGALVRTDDLDGDGSVDFAVPELAAAKGVGVLFVSGANLRVLARTEMAGAEAAVGAWVPATSSSPAGLLVAVQTATGTSLRWITPRSR